MDVHAHSTLMNGFMYGNVYEDITRYERQAIFPKLLCQNAEDFSLANTNFNRDAVKAGTGRRWENGLVLYSAFTSFILGHDISSTCISHRVVVLVRKYLIVVVSKIWTKIDPFPQFVQIVYLALRERWENR